MYTIVQCKNYQINVGDSIYGFRAIYGAKPKAFRFETMCTRFILVIISSSSIHSAFESDLT